MPSFTLPPGVKVALTAVLAAAAVAGAAGLAGTGAASPAAAAPAAPADAPGSLVEDFVHPNAEEILAERGIVLGRGDGHIALADCGGPTLIQLRSRAAGDVCFRAVGATGYLSMQVPSVYLIYGGDKNLTAKLTAASGQSKTYDVAAGLWKPVGESDTGVEAALMELRIV
ncbi:hypothetical protein [Amycolatopsis sp. 195334CR]|uniref:hypothetical protein n=1 Tax=Amycolatopsis sp. 195334CR TaxID=2814588 RepID=UPI001A8C706F|nr:hypothetical protein [Amycolatopsis sp. 195334CR]MBN6040613.1 hypothetical protein [Amycolatopsis sp. 195334CR]